MLLSYDSLVGDQAVCLCLQLSYEAHETEQQHHYSNNICDNAPQTMLHLQLAATVYLKTNGNRIVTGREGVAFYSLLEEHQLLQNKDISQVGILCHPLKHSHVEERS